MCQPLPSRREALKAALAASAGVVLFPADLVFGTVRPEEIVQGAFRISLATYPALRNVGGSVLLTVPGQGVTADAKQIVVTKTAASSYAAVSAFCTHERELVNAYSNITGRITCSAHGSRFTATGQVLLGPAVEPLPAYAATLDTASDSVVVEIPGFVAREDDPRVAALGFAAAPTVVRDATTVRFHLDAPAPVRLVAYDTLGREVAVLLDAPSLSGDVQAVWDARSASAGVYVLRLVAGDVQASTSVRVAR